MLLCTSMADDASDEADILNDIASFQTGFVVALLTAVFFFFFTLLSPQRRLTFANGSNVSLSCITYYVYLR